ncbi:MAG: hypothetical protein IPJ61_19260 [Tessaracoccus sp.]|uniref:hypothetical protein n=1 Tax=Tessaracoccus sp. TaxID=1971211 RepID=UPI001ECD5925|nr:hypothetical protein [Tessaracoccus sp.]MBK7823127.1 hypothetical protein [Tessaracoccus sp.]
MVKPKKPHIVGRTDIGIAVYGGTTYPLGAHLISPASLLPPPKPQAAHTWRRPIVGWSAIREACWALDAPPKRPRKKKLPQDGCPRRGCG